MCKLQGGRHGLQAASTMGLSGSCSSTSSSRGMAFTCVMEVQEQLGFLAQEPRGRQHECVLAAITQVHSNRAVFMCSAKGDSAGAALQGSLRVAASGTATETSFMTQTSTPHGSRRMLGPHRSPQRHCLLKKLHHYHGAPLPRPLV